MSEHPSVAPGLVDVALAESPCLERFYLLGGGSSADLRTDLSHALAAVLTAGSTASTPVIDLTERRLGERRQAQVAFTGPERRRRTVGL